MKKYLHAFNLIPDFCYDSQRKFWIFFRDFKYAWEKGKLNEFIRAGISADLAKKIIECRKEINIEYEMEKLRKNDIELVTTGSNEYPKLLKQIPDAPFLLYRKGALLNEHANCVSIVGTRTPSPYGEKIANQIAENIAACSGTIISGLAFGIDAICHRAAVKEGKPTIAVIASGLLNITPASHYKLVENILQAGGTLISEYACDRSSYKYQYLARNRIISGLSKSSIVIEARERSGALITARHALEQNRDVYALIGDITRPQAEGCNNLIEEFSAYPIVSMEALLGNLGFDYKKSQLGNLSEDERKIVSLLCCNTLTIDELLQKYSIGLSKMQMLITKLELKNIIRKNRHSKLEAVM